MAKGQDASLFIERINDFGLWLLSARPKRISLSQVAERICAIFKIEYCSIHIRGQEGGLSVSGNFADEFHLELPDSLKVHSDHPFGALELAEEQLLNVRNFPVRMRNGSNGLLVVRSDSLSNEAISLIALLIGLFLSAGAN